MTAAPLPLASARPSPVRWSPAGQDRRSVRSWTRTVGRSRCSVQTLGLVFRPPSCAPPPPPAGAAAGQRRLGAGQWPSCRSCWLISTRHAAAATQRYTTAVAQEEYQPSAHPADIVPRSCRRLLLHARCCSESMEGRWARSGRVWPWQLATVGGQAADTDADTGSFGVALIAAGGT